LVSYTPARFRPTPLAAALIAMAGSAWAQDAEPVTVIADELRGRPGVETQAEGDVELHRGSVVLRADRITYRHPEDLAHARGNVRIEADGNWFEGTELQLYLQRFEGFFLQPRYHIALTGGGGSAERFDFIDRNRASATAVSYTTCPRDGSGDPDWLLSADSVRFDFEANEGVARGAVLRFFGVPILGAPVLSFPLSEERKSGWLPPRINLDNRSGLELAVPYYWNIAPNRDMTLTPAFLSRRGVGLQTEFRYLQPRDRGEVTVDLLPDDRVEGRSRSALQFLHEGDKRGIHYRADLLRVSDDEYWKDFPRAVPAVAPRLLPLDLRAERPLGMAGDWLAYARVQHWQVLQDPEALIVPPYQRSPQVGLRGAGALRAGLRFALETELNRFTHPEDDNALTGARWHAIGALSRPWGAPGWWVTPRVAFNAAGYNIDQAFDPRGRRRTSRVIPTGSVDAGLLFERDASWFGRAFRQTLEPRLLYVNTPFREQADLPNFDSAGKDFNLVSVFSENAFSGVDRVSDAHQLTAGVTTRLLDPRTAGELLRLGLAQRLLFRDQRITPEGPPLTQRVSDLLLLGSSRVSSKWSFDAAVQYSPDIGRATRSVLLARYSPGPFRNVAAGYRLTRGLTENVDLGWQWPVYGPAPGESSTQCAGTLYSVGHINYSMRDSRITDSIFGFEYDAGCWIARVVGERVSTGRREATTRLLLQLELVGLSRLGSNPLQVLKDNIPGYRLLREARPSWPAKPPVYE
jgi:LPS-assembly protein